MAEKKVATCDMCGYTVEGAELVGVEMAQAECGCYLCVSCLAGMPPRTDSAESRRRILAGSMALPTQKKRCRIHHGGKSR